MSEHLTPEPDLLGDLLAPPLPADDRLCGDLRERTARVVRWRRRWRRLARTAALAACYAAGVLTMHGLAPHVPPPPQMADHRDPPKEVVPPETPALALEWKAIDSPQPRPDLYRRAGDLYLEEEKDPESALRCYGQALDAAGAADQAVAAEDSWLLMVIKNARQKEKRYAKSLD
jgi:hypothetical protein